MGGTGPGQGAAFAYLFLEFKRSSPWMELLWARLIFALGAVVTAATVVMILRGHLHWNRRGSMDVR